MDRSCSQVLKPMIGREGRKVGIPMCVCYFTGMEPIGFIIFSIIILAALPPLEARTVSQCNSTNHNHRLNVGWNFNCNTFITQHSQCDTVQVLGRCHL